MPDRLLPLLANRNNQAILGLLAVEPAYPRMVGQLLSLSETEVSRRLKRMEEVGLVVGEWRHLGKNVKVYRLAARGASVRFTNEGVAVALDASNGGERRDTVVLAPQTAPTPLVDSFVGRETDLARLASDRPVVLVEGIPGIGKTSLLAAYATNCKTGTFWHSFRGMESLRWLANRLAVSHAQNGDRGLIEALANEPDVADLHELVLNALDRPSTIHILDDVHLAEDEAVRRLISDAVARTNRGRLRIAAREPPRHDPTLPHVDIIELSGLDDDAVLDLARQKGLDVDATFLPRIRDEVGGHPLALNLLLEAAQAEGSLEALLDRIPEKATEEYLLREVDESLNDAEREVLMHASLFRTGFDIDDLRAISRRDPERSVLRLRRRLLIGHDGQKYQLHEMVRNFFYHRLMDKPRLHEKVARRYLDLETTEGRLEAMHHFQAAGRRERVLQLLEDDLDLRAFDFLDASYHNLYQSILDTFTPDEVQDPQRWALIEDEKGDIAYHRGDYAVALAHYEEAGKAFTAKRHAERVADLAWKRALALDRLGRRPDARNVCGEGLQIAPADGVSRERLDALQRELAA